MLEATRVIRATLTEPVAGTPLHAGPVLASPYHTPGDPTGALYSYGRSHNPTWTALEEALGKLEVGDGETPTTVRVFASGMAAVAAVFGSVLRPGDTVVLPANAYFGARQLLKERFEPMGVSLRLVDTDMLTDPVTLAGARLVWLETPSNPVLEITEIEAVAALAHAAGALVAVDNTTASPLGQRPLALGADFSVSSDSKAISGHSDVLLGHVAVHDAALLTGLDRERTLTGAIAGPMEAWLTLRSLATLPLRLERSSANALALASFLAGREGVLEVLYPGLATHPGHRVAAAQMRHFGPVLSLTLAGQAQAERFFTRSRLITEATSFGGITTTGERRARWGHDSIAPGFIRLSIGCEDLDDLREDIAQALRVDG